jgi:hypothetical protein
MFPTSFHLSMLAVAALAGAPATAPAPAPAITASVEQCVPSTEQAERSATFTAQMSAIEGTQRMAIQFEVEERSPAATVWSTVVDPGLSDWRSSEPGVKIYKYVKQVTNLAAPADFRAVVRYRWFDNKGHVLKRATRHTSVCTEPVDIQRVASRAPLPSDEGAR